MGLQVSTGFHDLYSKARKARQGGLWKLNVFGPEVIPLNCLPLWLGCFWWFLCTYDVLFPTIPGSRGIRILQSMHNVSMQASRVYWVAPPLSRTFIQVGEDMPTIFTHKLGSLNLDPFWWCIHSHLVSHLVSHLAQYLWHFQQWLDPGSGFPFNK